MRAYFFLILLLLTGTIFAQESRLREGDQLDIRIGGVPQEESTQITGPYQIDGQGFINLAHIGKIKAAGLTQGELQTAVENAYRSQQIYTNPSIIIGTTSKPRWVDVNGDVKTPRRVEFTPDLTIEGAITGAGGLTEYANPKRVVLTRGDKKEIINLIDIRKGKVPNVRLQPGDSIVVERSFW